MLPSREPALARRLAPQTASGNESLPGAILPYWPARAFDEPRFRGLHDNFPEPKDTCVVLTADKFMTCLQFLVDSLTQI